MVVDGSPQAQYYTGHGSRFENNSVIFGETHMHSLSHTQRQLVRAGCDGVNVDVLKVHNNGTFQSRFLTRSIIHVQSHWLHWRDVVEMGLSRQLGTYNDVLLTV